MRKLERAVWEEALLMSNENYTGYRRGARKPDKRKKKSGRGLKALLIVLIALLALEGLYCFVVFTNNPTIRALRESYIETAMSTMSHHWLAEWFFPDYMIQEVVSKTEQAKQDQVGIISKWDTPNASAPSHAEVEPESGRDAFFELFWELDKASFDAYAEQHPETLANGWENIKINESGLDDDGTSIRTTMDEQVLAIDAKNKILIVRVQGDNFIGALAIAKDPSQLSLAPAEHIGSVGEQLHAIAESNNALLAMTGSGFMDPDGSGSGGDIAGYAMCRGKTYGEHFPSGYKRIELHEDNLLYVADSTDPVGAGTTDAVEFSPALIVDGKALVDEFSPFTGICPRTCIGQSSKREVLLLIIEGRMIGRSLGCNLASCVEILQRHDCYQAINLDGGSSSVLWYDGQYVTKCANTSIVSRLLPNAWVYGTRES